MKKGFEINFNTKLKKSTLLKKELELANKLNKERYSTKQWNLKL